MNSHTLLRTTLYFLLFFIIVAVTLLAVVTTDIFDIKPTAFISSQAAYEDSALPIEKRVASLLSYMTLEEKIGQMTLVEKNSVQTMSDLSEYSLGALLSGSGAKPEENTVAGWKDMTDRYQAQAAKSRLGIPLLYGSDAIHGHAHVSEVTVFPHMIGLGAAGSPPLVKKVAAATAEDMQATGVNWNFAPNLDTPQDIRWGRVYETFSDDPTLVSKLGAAYVEGLQQGDEPTGPIKILATPKHFVGLGGMTWNSSQNENYLIDQGVTVADEALLQTVYLPPFAAAVDAGALSIMVGLNTWGDTRTVRQHYLLTDVLKGQLGFQGFIVSDWYGVHEGTSNTFFATVQAVNAGVDMVMLPFDYQTFLQHMKWANRLGLISNERIDDAVSRILYAKFSLGLFDQTDLLSKPAVTLPETHRTLARDAVAQSLVLLKNEETILPLKTSNQKIRVAGSAADNVGRQMGAWSIEWQGIDGNWPDNSTSILTGIQSTVDKSTSVEYDVIGNFSIDSPKADIGIAIVGEGPYAEGWGDTANPTLSEADKNAIENLKRSSDLVVVILVTGRPLIITEDIADWDAVVVAWLPGSEGAGVSDVLFGEKEFFGTLPLPWPASTKQVPITASSQTTDGSKVLFPRYFGLQY